MQQPILRAYGLTESQVNSFKAELEAAQKADKDLPMKVGCLGSLALSAVVSTIVGLSQFRSSHSVFGGVFTGIGCFLGTTSMIAGFIVVPFSRIFESKRFSRATKLQESELYRSILRYEADAKRYEELCQEKAEAERRRKVEFWLSLTGHQFEHEMADIFRKLGYQAKVTKGSGDGGIDIILAKNGQTTLVQCKAHKKPVGPHVVRDLFGTLINHGADRAILVSLSGVTSGVRAYISDKPMEILTLEDILEIQQSI